MSLTDRIFHSRPRAEADWECPRRRYWLYEFDGKGLNAEVESFEMFFGTTQHDGLAAIATFHRDQKGDVPIDLIATTAHQQMFEKLMNEGVGKPEEIENFAREQAALSEGLLRGFYMHVWPRMMAEYPRILAIETDVSFRHNLSGEADPNGQFEFLAKPDLVMASEDMEQIIYREYKTTANKKEKWINSWDKSVQVHATRAAITQSLKIEPTGVIVQGLYKGYESYGKLATPIAYAYHKWGNPPFTKTETLYEYKPGFRRYPSWQLEGGVKKWVEEMPEDVIMEQYPCTPVIFPDDDLLTRFFRQRALRELEIASARQSLADIGPEAFKQQVMDTAFPQHNHKCKPAWGFECPMQVLCFGSINDPLKAGFSYRRPHHAAEVAVEETE